MKPRSKFGIDIMYRLWDSHRSCWAKSSGRTLWLMRQQVERIREQMIAAGRNPDHLTVEAVQVGIVL